MLQLAFPILKIIGKVALSFVGGGILGDVLVDVLPDLSKEIWDKWNGGKQASEQQRRQELQDVAQAAAEQVRDEVALIVQEIAADKPPEVRDNLASFLMLVPASIRRSLRRAEDPTGTTVPPNLSLNKPEDLLPFLPARLPRFKVGDHPLPGADYDLVELLGVGGFGEVWKARNPYLSSAPPVALKFCLDPSAKNRLLRHEAAILDRVMSQVKHPGIVRLVHTYLTADPPCLVYEFVEGGELTGLIQQWHTGKKKILERANRVLLNLAEIVGSAHQLQPAVVHRDLKPANILVKRLPDGKIGLRIADFGIGGLAVNQAIAQSRRGTTLGQVLVPSLRGAYTPLYASPQQMKGQDADPSDDVFSLGVIWYQMLTGDFTTGRPGGTKWARRVAEMGMSIEMIDLLTSCFEEDRHDRPANAAELAKQLKLLVGRVPPKPPTPSPGFDDVDELTRKFEECDDETLAATVSQRQWKTGELCEIALPGATTIKFAWVPPGSFEMGSPANEVDRKKGEVQHRVTLTKGFFMGTYPVTRGQFRCFVEARGYKTQAESAGGAHAWRGSRWKVDSNCNWLNPGFNQDDNHPVVCISWIDAIQFCFWLTKASGDAGNIALPTEAQWEYACRGAPSDSKDTFPFYFKVASRELISPQANFNGNYPYGGAAKGQYLERTSTVGSYESNTLGLHDMHGNVSEWCRDISGPYDTRGKIDPERTTIQNDFFGNVRVKRGGSWFEHGHACRAADRDWLAPEARNSGLGFRVVLTPNL